SPVSITRRSWAWIGPYSPVSENRGRVHCSDVRRGHAHQPKRRRIGIDQTTVAVLHVNQFGRVVVDATNQLGLCPQLLGVNRLGSVTPIPSLSMVRSFISRKHRDPLERVYRSKFGAFSVSWCPDDSAPPTPVPCSRISPDSSNWYVAVEFSTLGSPVRMEPRLIPHCPTGSALARSSEQIARRRRSMHSSLLGGPREPSGPAA